MGVVAGSLAGIREPQSQFGSTLQFPGSGKRDATQAARERGAGRAVSWLPKRSAPRTRSDLVGIAKQQSFWPDRDASLDGGSISRPRFRSESVV